MANGKFSNPRTPKNEDLEIEEAFRQVMGEAPVEKNDDHFAQPDGLQDDDLLADLMLDELLRDDIAPTPIPDREPAPVQAPPVPQEEWILDNEPEDTGSAEAPAATPTMVKNRKIALISIITAALIVVAGIIFAVSYMFGGIGDDGLILDNVVVGGVDLGGMTREEAAKALHAATDLTYTGKDMVVILPDTTLVFTPTQTGAVLNVDAAVEAAYEYGRTGSLAERNAAKEQAATNEYHIGLLPYLSLNIDYIRQQLDAYGASFNSTFCASSYELTGKMPALEGDEFDLENPCQTLLLNTGRPGRNLDINAIYNQVLDAYSFNSFQVDASGAAPQEDPEPLDLEAIWAEFYVEPENATMDMETFEAIGGSYGYGFDLELAAQLLAEAEPGAVVSVPMEYVIPEETRETLEALLFRDVLSYVETPHTNNANRNNNLERACASINGLVLMPGDVFDYNETLGERTIESGYKAAGAYADGQTVLEVGGGICQVSSTLYYASLLADMEIVTRSAHSYASNYIDLGMDATVSWKGPEFRFSNNSNYPIRIEAEVSGGYVKVWIIGTDDKDYYVKMEHEVLGIRDYETIYEDYPEDNEEGYKDGDIVQSPYVGYTVKTYRCKYSKETGKLLSRDYEATSRYNVRDLIIARVSSGETEAPSEAPSETPSTDPTESPTETPVETQTPTEDPTTPPTEAPTGNSE